MEQPRLLEPGLLKFFTQQKFFVLFTEPKFLVFSQKTNPAKVSYIFPKMSTTRVHLKEPILRPTKFFIFFSFGLSG